jgi:hypothetical protein
MTAKRTERDMFEAWMIRYPHERGAELFKAGQPDGLHAIWNRDTRTYTYNDGSEHFVNCYWQAWQARSA